MRPLLWALILLGPVSAWAKESPRATYHVARKIGLPGAVGYYDFLTIDEAARRLYVSHGDEVVVVEPTP